MEATIAILTYFGNTMTVNCVNSILQNVQAPKIWIYKNDIGWLKAANKAMKEIQGDIILLNDDTIVLRDIVQEMITLAYSDPKIGVVGGVSLAPNGETVQNYGIYVAPDGNTAHKHYGQPKNVLATEKQQAVEGSCMFIKREVIDSIGYFDEEYGSGYREEVDFCFRAREAGYKIMSTPRAEYVHFTRQTHAVLGIENDKFDYFNEKWGNKLKLGKV